LGEKNYGLTVDLKSSAKIVYHRLAAAAVTYLFVNELGFSSIIRLIIGTLFFAVAFGAAILLTKTLNKSDIENLCAMASGLGKIGKIFSRALNVYQKIMETLKL
jgi:hypothetical protein